MKKKLFNTNLNYIKHLLIKTNKKKKNKNI